MSDQRKEPDYAGQLYRTFAAPSRVTMAVERMMFGDPPGEDPNAAACASKKVNVVAYFDHKLCKTANTPTFVGGIVATAVTTSERSARRLSIRCAMEPNLVHGFSGPLLSLVTYINGKSI